MKGIRVAAACAATIAAAALAAERPTEVTRARNSAVGYALTMDRVTDSFAGRCGTIRGESARAARAEWKERNGDLVRSADRYLEFVRRLVKQEKGEEAAKRFYDEQKRAIADQAQLTVIDSLISSGDGEREVCGKVLEAMQAGRMDFEAAPAQLRALEEIRADMAPRVPK